MDKTRVEKQLSAYRKTTLLKHMRRTLEIIHYISKNMRESEVKSITLIADGAIIEHT